MRRKIIAALKQCSKAKDLEGGKKVHLDAVAAGHHTNKYVAAALIAMYSRCRDTQRAREVFDKTSHKDVVTWTSLILGYVENGESWLALDLFTNIDCEPDRVTYIAALKACGGLASGKQSQKQIFLEKGMAIHEGLRDRGFDSDIVAENTLLDMYSKCGSMQRAQQVFDGMIQKNVVTWTSLILGYVENGNSSVAMDLFSRMDCEPNHVTYIAALKACAGFEKSSERRSFLVKGISLHRQLKDRGFDANPLVANTLLDMYCKCGSMQRARQVFDRVFPKDVITWTTLILGYVENGESSLAMDLFASMDCEPNSFTYAAVIKACASLGSESDSGKHIFLEKGIAFHRRLGDRAFASGLVLGNNLLDMYAKCGCMQRAREVFDKMLRKDAVSWTSLILGYVESGESSMAIDLFTQIDCEPDHITYAAGLKACGSLATLRAGQVIHVKVCELGLEQDELLATALVDFYAKCGSMDAAQVLFNSMRSPTIVTWTSLIKGYSSLGDSSQVFRLAKRTQEAGLEMDDITHICVLTACSHAGLVEEGKRYFESIPGQPTLDHYTCMIDMLGRANMLEEALSIVNSMPFKANSVTWKTLLAACRKWKNLEVGKVAFDALIASDKRDGAAYVLMSDVYGSLGM